MEQHKMKQCVGFFLVRFRQKGDEFLSRTVSPGTRHEYTQLKQHRGTLHRSQRKDQDNVFLSKSHVHRLWEQRASRLHNQLGILLQNAYKIVRWDAYLWVFCCFTTTPAQTLHLLTTFGLEQFYVQPRPRAKRISPSQAPEILPCCPVTTTMPHNQLGILKRN